MEYFCRNFLRSQRALCQTEGACGLLRLGRGLKSHALICWISLLSREENEGLRRRGPVRRCSSRMRRNSPLTDLRILLYKDGFLCGMHRLVFARQPPVKSVVGLWLVSGQFYLTNIVKVTGSRKISSPSVFPFGFLKK